VELRETSGVRCDFCDSHSSVLFMYLSNSWMLIPSFSRGVVILQFTGPGTRVFLLDSDIIFCLRLTGNMFYYTIRRFDENVNRTGNSESDFHGFFNSSMVFIGDR
jgi:hypothetical protein